MAVRLLSVLSLVVTPALAVADEPAFVIQPGGYIQPGFRLIQNSPVGNDEDGFTLGHVRPTLRLSRADAGITYSAYIEADTTPQFQLLDAYVAATGDFADGVDAGWRIALGQLKPPISRATLVSDADLQLPTKPQLTSIAPDRQLGLAATVNLPFLPWLELSAGFFNGDGKNLTTNPDENFMFVGRIAVRPIGPRVRLIESALGPDSISAAGSAATVTIAHGTYDETDTYLGADGFVSWNGLSATAEILNVHHSFTAGAPLPDFDSLGLEIQAGYLLPLPGFFDRKIEVGGRFEQIDRNDTVPIPQPGNADQSLSTFTLFVSYYHFKHDLKLQIMASHIHEVEDRTASGQNASYDNDSIIAQVTFRL